MPAIKLLLRRTFASATMNPPSILSSPATGNISLHLSGTGTSSLYCVGSRSMLAKKGACFRDKKLTTPTYIKHNNTIVMKDIGKSGILVLSCSPYSSASSSFQEERDSENKLHKLSSSSSLMAEISNSNKQSDWDLCQNGVDSLSPNKEQKQQHASKFLTLPTVLTLARVVAVPVFIATFYAENCWGAAATTSIFVGAAVTDWLDGYLARKMRQGTAFGAFLDPVADKLMVAATLVLLCSRPPASALYETYPWLLPAPAIAIIGREITMSAVREWAASQDAKLLQAVAVNNLGKWKTATQMVSLTIILATRDNSVSSQGALATSGVGLLYISAGLAVWSLIVYMRKIWKVLLR